MRFLDMTPYTPFRPMGQSSRTRPIRAKTVRWVKPEPLKTRADIQAAAELWRHAYPELYGSSHDFMLYPEDYEARMAMVETWEDDSIKKPCCMLVVQETATGRLAAASLMTKYDQNLQIE
jgi:hypothetical protein